MRERVQIVRLQRLLMPERRTDTVLECAIPSSSWYRILWQWIGGATGVVHPHPQCHYWIDNREEPATRPPGEDLIQRGEN